MIRNIVGMKNTITSTILSQIFNKDKLQVLVFSFYIIINSDLSKRYMEYFLSISINSLFILILEYTSDHFIRDSFLIYIPILLVFCCTFGIVSECSVNK